MKRPSFQFYPSDWLSDTALRMCSEGARGVWIDMICFMHEGTPYGHLKVNGKVILPEALARMIGIDRKRISSYLDELETAGVVQRDGEGAYFSKRMVRDEQIREARAAGGHKGGNPELLKPKVNLPDNLSPETEDKPNPTPSSSSSSSPSGEVNLALGECEPKKRKARTKKPETTLRDYLDSRKAASLPAISPDSCVMEYADRIGLPDEFLAIAWYAYQQKYLNADKTYADWTRAFRNALEDGWLGIWWLNGTTFELTTKGKQAQIAMTSGAKQ